MNQAFRMCSGVKDQFRCASWKYDLMVSETFCPTTLSVRILKNMKNVNVINENKTEKDKFKTTNKCLAVYRGQGCVKILNWVAGGGPRQ